jgi:predicted amidohydrolase
VKAAVIQAAPVAFDLDATLAKAARLASDADADLVVFPEGFVPCYPRGYAFGAVVGERSAEGRTWFRRYWESSIDVPGPETDRLGAIARETSSHLVIGVTERGCGTLYCTVLFFAPDGTLLGKHRKLVPTASERLIWGSGDGSTMPVFDTPLGRLGATVCWETYMPLLRVAMYRKGIQLYCVPTADARETWVASMRHVACEGRCFVLSANQFARRSDYPDDYPVDFPADHVMCRGNSVIVSPLGELLAGPATDGEVILHAEIDVGRTIEGKFDLDVGGHYSRPDIFRFEVDERPLD